MNHLYRRRNRQDSPPVLPVRRECRHTQAWPDALAAIQCAVAHSFMNPLGRRRFRRKELGQSAVDGRTDTIEKHDEISVHFRIRTGRPALVLSCSLEESRPAVRLAPISCGKIATI